MQVERDMTGTLRKETHGHNPVIAIQTGHTAANGSNISENVSQTLNRDAAPSVAFTQNQAGDVLTGEVMHNLGTNSNATGRNAANVHAKMQVRRLTPTECERLQGFPDGHTNIPSKQISKARYLADIAAGKDSREIGNGQYFKMTADGARYKALGNSMAVNVMSFIGQRIQMCDEVLSDTRPHSPNP